jgi:hypothetical protein
MVASNRLADAFDGIVARSAKRSAMVSELHYAVKDVSDEAFGYLLKVAKSLAVQDAGPVDPTGLIGQTRVVITGEHTADVAIVWSFRTEAFMSSEYRRLENGGWISLDGKPISPTWLTRLEDRYQEKLKQVQLAALSEVTC